MMKKEEVFGGMKLNGIMTLILNLALLVLIIGGVIWTVNAELSDTVTGILVTLAIILFVINSFLWVGFIQIEPNEAIIMIFFGKYKGTIKENGYFWVNPFYTKRKLTLRARNLDADPIKVNDKNGNPVMIGQIIVWKVVDTYKACFDIDNTSKVKPVQGATVSLNDRMLAYENFVKVQGDAALRFVAGQYAYDNSIDEDEKLTLRAGGEEINDILENQLNERLALAGIEVIEARINYLAYAPEIAAVMLRRQQADAIIAAREKIVEGAVGMVKHALEKLSEEEIIELDNDKKAAMVSNLMVVLCSDESAQPVLNTGTLHQ